MAQSTHRMLGVPGIVHHLVWLTVGLLLSRSCDKHQVQSFSFSQPNPPKTVFLRLSNRNHHTKAWMSSPKHDEEEELNEVTATLIHPHTQQEIHIIGTKHGSESSSRLVKRLVADVQPNLVLIELDRGRASKKRHYHFLQFPKPSAPKGGPKLIVTDVEQVPIEIPESFILQHLPGLPNQFWYQLEQKPWLRSLLQPYFTIQSNVNRIVGEVIKEYLGKLSENDAEETSEFDTAIFAAWTSPSCTHLVLGDVSNIETCTRVAQLAFWTGRPLQFFQKCVKVVVKESERILEPIRRDWNMTNDGEPTDEELLAAFKDQLDLEGDSLALRVTDLLQENAPELVMAFLHERNYIMSKALQRDFLESDNPRLQKAVVVVGKAHVRGVKQQLQAIMKEEDTAPSSETSCHH